MQVTETKNEGLKREFQIVIPAADIEASIDSRLKELAGTVRLPGFRPGHAPVKLMRQRFGDAVLAEVVEQVIGTSSSQLLGDRGLRLAVQPDVKVTRMEKGADLEFTVALEILPDIAPPDFSNVKLERLVVHSDEGEVEKTLGRLAEAYRSMEPIADDRPAADGDVVVIDFTGSVDGKEFPGGRAEGYYLQLGSKSFIPGFEDQLVGAKAGSRVTVTVTFPADYATSDLAGKEAAFEVDVKEIREARLATIDDELAKRAGKENLEALKQVIRETHGAQFKDVSRQRLKRALLDTLAATHDFAVPEGLVEHEANAIWQQVEEQKKSGMPDPEFEGKSDEELRTEVRGIAERRVRLALLLAEVGRTNNISVTKEDLGRAMMAEAGRYPGQEAAVLRYFRENPRAQEMLKAPLLEDKVVDFVLELVQLTERTVTVDELMKDPDAPADAAAAKEPAEEKA